MTQLNRHPSAREAGLNRTPSARDAGLNHPGSARDLGLSRTGPREPRSSHTQASETSHTNQPVVRPDVRPPPRDTNAALNFPALANLELILNEAERRALVAVLRSRPELTLDKLQDCFAGRYGATLRTITIRELLETPTEIELPEDGGPLIDRSALEQAKRLNGPAFDECVLQAVRSAGGQPVSASYLRARVGGPRWKLQGSLRRLVDAGEVERDGVTSSTRYRPLRS